MKEQNKIRRYGFFAGLLVVSSLILGMYLKTGAAAVQDQAPGDSLITPEIEQWINEYTLGTVSPSVFKEGVQEVLPFQAHPYNKFNLSLGGKQTYQSGDNLEVQGTLSFSSQAQAETQKYLGDCQKLPKGSSQCLDSPIYTFSTLEDLGLYVQVFRRDESEDNATHGDFLIDEFFALQGADLKENEIKKFTVNWRLPEKVKEGSYYLAFYVTSNKEFDLWGSPLVPYSWAKLFDFSVVSGDETTGSGIELDKDNIRINGGDYSYRQPAPEVTPDNGGEITVELPLTNLDLQTETVNLKYELYRFGHADPKNLVDNREETKVVNMGEKTVLRYSFKPGDQDSIYSVKVFARSGNGFSQANIRFVVAGKDRGIFRFLGLAKNQGSSYPLFCLRDAAWNGLFQGKVKITLADDQGNALGKFEQDANVKPETRCFVLPHLKLDEPICGALTGEIQDKQGKTVDKKKVVLPCAASPKTGVTASLQSLGQELSLKGRKNWVILFVAFAFAISGGLLYLNHKRKKNEE